MGTIIAHSDEGKLLVPIGELTAAETFLHGSTGAQFLEKVRTKQSGEYLSLYEGSLYITSFMRMPETDWMLVHRIRIIQALRHTLVSFIFQTILYVFIILVLYRYMRSFVSKEIAPIDDIFQQIRELCQHIRKTDCISGKSFSDLLVLSREGLSDSLTGLPTRTVFLQQAEENFNSVAGQIFGLFFIDMDNLKSINDQLDISMVMQLSRHLPLLCKNL